MAILDWLGNGWWELSALALVAVTLVLTHITMISVTVYLHRHSAHRAVDLHPVLKHFFRFWLWMTTGMNTKEWTAIHRKHHATCETVDDPHSPQIQGIKKIFWEGAEVYRAAATPETLKRYGAGTPDDWLERNVYSRYTIGGVSAMLIIDVALFGAAGLTIWAVQMMWTPVFAAGVINGIGHYWGYRNFECHDAARNIVPWGIVIAGEELHNNHHTYPNSAKLSQKPWEFDIGWMYIRLFEILGLAKARSKGPGKGSRQTHAGYRYRLGGAERPLPGHGQVRRRRGGAPGGAGTDPCRQCPAQRGANREAGAVPRCHAGGRGRREPHCRAARHQPAAAGHL